MSSVVISGDTSGAVTISAPAVAGTTTLTLPAVSGTILQSGTTVTEAQGGTGTTTGYYGFKNRIINGAMVIDQRNAGASITPTNNQYLVDRWQAAANVASKFSAQQSTTAPAGFINSQLATSLSAYTIGASELCALRQSIEGLNVGDLGWGTANAQTITVSFWVRSSLTGTFGGSIMNSAADRSYPFTYTISTANTFEYKAVTIAGDTSGTWLTTNGIGLSILFGLGVGTSFSGTAGAWAGASYYGATGATSVVGTSGATFYITGVQLEKGSTATSFDYRPYGTELALCQRYFCKTFPAETAPAQNLGYTGALGAISINAGSSTALWMHWQFPSEMRTTPTLTTFSPGTTNANWYSPAGPSSTTTAGTFAGSTRFLNIYNTNAPAAGADVVYYIQATATSEL